MIPKKLHYIWVGEYDTIPEIEKQWKETTEKNNKDYKVKFWSEKDVPTNDFLEVCMEKKLYWAVADYIRLCVLYKEGGIYIDTDVELIKPIPKEWNSFELILPKETDYYISSFFIGTIPRSRFIKSLLDVYNNYNKKDDLDIDSWVPPQWWGKTAEKIFGKFSIQKISDGSYKSSDRLRLLSFSEMCPYYPWDKKRINQLVSTKNSIGIHYWNNYKKTNNIELDSYNSKFFKNE